MFIPITSSRRCTQRAYRALHVPRDGAGWVVLILTLEGGANLSAKDGRAAEPPERETRTVRVARASRTG